MALAKNISLGNGVVTNYHRIVSVNCITNVQNIVEVCSYTSKAKRLEEKAAAQAIVDGTSDEPADVYTDTRYITCQYDPAMTVDRSYAYLKTLDDFSGATDC